MCPSNEPDVLDYQAAPNKPGSSTDRRVWECTGVAVAVAATVNGVLIFVASSQRVWISPGIAIVVAPIVNIALIVMACVTRSLVKHRAGGASTSVYVLTGTLVPIAAIFLDAVLIVLMNWPNC
jgi:hypothetical protein